MAKKLADNKVIVVPKVITAIERIKRRLEGTDRDDQVEEVDNNEKKAKDAILKLSAYGHEGIQLLVKQAREELKTVVEEMSKEPTGELLDPFKYAIHQQGLLATRKLWLWFLDFFNEAAQSLKEVNDFVAKQDEPEINSDY